MRQLILTLGTLFLISSICTSFAFGQNSDNNENAPMISFEETSYDFGDIVQDEKVSHIFKFTNTGQAPLVISNVITSCGCTASKWPRTVIAAGESDSIKISFDSRGKMGLQNKVITIISNATMPQSRIKIMVNVLPH